MRLSQQALKSWVSFVENIRPWHLWATFTFRTTPNEVARSPSENLEQYLKGVVHEIPEQQALNTFRRALIEESRASKQHMFAFYGYGLQRNGTTHVHALLSFERYAMGLEPIQERWNQLQRCSEAAHIEKYDPMQNAAAYILQHQSFALFSACPRNQNRCNKRNRMCWFEEDASRWRRTLLEAVA